VRITENEMASNMKSYGVPGDYAELIAGLDTFVSEGKEARLNDCVEEITGKKPRTLEDFVDECIEKRIWVKED
jgi:festuclavine dehydrogenase